MESHTLNKLAKKYWEGACSEQEEQELFKALQAGNLTQEHVELAEYLSFLQSEGETLSLGEEFDQEILSQISNRSSVKLFKPKIWLSIAAAIALVLSISLGINQLLQQEGPKEIALEVDTYEDPALALQEVQKALLLLSSNMNEGAKQASVLGEFHKAKEELNTIKNKRTDESN